MAAMKSILAAVAVFTAVASCWLFVMYLVLKHPGYQAQASIAVLFVLQSVLTLILIATGDPAPASAGREGPQAVRTGLRLIVLAGAIAVALAGGSAVYSTLSGPHFEGFALLIGTGLVLQGLLTLATFARPLPFLQASALRS